MKKIILRVLLAILVVVIVLVVNVVWFKPFFIRAFYEKVFVQVVFDSPELLSRLRLVEGLGVRGHNQHLDDASETFTTRQLNQLRANLTTLHRYDTTGMRGQDRLNYQILDWYLTNQVAGAAFRYDNYPVNQISGVQNDFPSFMADVHQVHNRRDAEYYNHRLSELGRKFGQVRAGLQARARHGVVPPTFMIDRVLTEMRTFVAAPPTQNLLYTAFADKLAKADDLDAAAQTELLAETKRQLETSVYPAYQQLITHFAALRPRSTNDAGVWKFPDGKAFYAHCLRTNTTTNLSAAEIQALGRREVARISAQILAIMRPAGPVSADTVGRMLTRLAAQPRYQFPATDSGRAQVLAEYRRILTEVNAGLDPAFRIRPKAPLEVRRVPEFKEVGSPGAYYESPALDGSRPGVFYANLREQPSRVGMRTLAYHEGIPGHHFQLGIQQELTGLPTFRTVIPFTAYAEGWALYAERLASEMGFERTAADSLGRLQAELFRAARLVVDTGLHDRRWTREQAIDYLRRVAGLGEQEATAEVERYIAWPGQACAYKVGMLKILALRERARQQLGPRFDPRDFHDAVLRNGAVPLEILEQIVDDYIKAKKAA